METLTNALVAKVQAHAKDKEAALKAKEQAELLLAQTALDAQKRKWIAWGVGILATLVSAGVTSWAGTCQANN